MKVKINVGELREGLAQAGITLDKRKYQGAPLVSILAKKADNAQRLLMYTSDGMAESLIRLTAEVTDEGECAIEPSRLIHLLSLAPGNETAALALTPKGNQLSLKIKGTQSKMAVNGTVGQLLEQIKHLPINKPADLLIRATGFREILERTQHFTSQDASQCNLHSVVIQTAATGYEGLASDSVVLARVSVEDENATGKTETFRIPAQSIPALRKVLDRNKGNVLKLIFDRDENQNPRRLFVRTDNTVYGTTLSSESFPNTDKIFSAPIVVSMKLPAQQLTNSMSQAELFAHERYVSVLLDNSGIKIRASGTDGEFEQELTAEPITWPEGTKATKMGFNVKKLMSVSRALRDEAVELAYATGLKMAFIKTQNDAGSARYAIAGAAASTGAA